MILIQLDADYLEYDLRGLLLGFWTGAAIRRKPWEEEITAEDFLPIFGKEYANTEDLLIRVNGGGNLTGEFWQNSKKIELELSLFEDHSLRIIQEETVSEEEINRYDRKTAYKRGIYRLLCRYTGKELPWGTLTGIRPTKIPMRELLAGASVEQMIHTMTDAHLVSEKKAALSVEIAEREKAVLDRVHGMDGYSLYVGIPFCPTTCLYCSFTSYPIGAWKKRSDLYVDALLHEMKETASVMNGKPLDTVYFGGGTPTSLEAEQLDRLLSGVEEYYDLSCLQELTVEAGRPDSVTEEKLRVLKKHGVTRISVNPQTMKDETLKILGRQHTVQQVKDVFALSRDMGFDNINMDLILGLPNESLDDVKRTLDEVCSMAPESITVHSLALKRAARLNLERGKYQHLSFENSWERMDAAEEYCRSIGLLPYYLYRQKNMAGNFENTGFAKPGKEGIYNILIMEEVQSIAACGPGTVSKCVKGPHAITRCDDVKEVGLYIEQVDEMIERKRRLFSD